MAQKERIDIPFVGGLQESIAAKLLPPDGSLTELNDAVVDAQAAISKRPDFDSAGNIAGETVQKISELNNMPIACTDGGFHVNYADDQWREVDTYRPMRASYDYIDGPTNPVVATSSDIDQDLGISHCLSNGYYVYVHGLYFTVIHATTRAVMQGPTLYGNPSFDQMPARVVPIAGTTKVVVLFTQNNVDWLIAKVLDMATPTVAPSQVTLVTDLDRATPEFDVIPLVNNPGHFMVAYRSTTGTNQLSCAVFDDTGSAVGSTLTQTAILNTSNVSMANDLQTSGSDYVHIAARDSTSTELWIVDFNGSTLTQNTAPATISGTVGTTYKKIVGVGVDTDEVAFFIVYTDSLTPQQPGAQCLGFVSNRTSGPTAAATLSYCLSLISKPVLYDGSIFFLITTGNNTFTVNTLFLMEIATDLDTTTLKIRSRILVGRGCDPDYSICDFFEESPDVLIAFTPFAGASYATGGSPTPTFGVARLEFDFTESGNSAVIGNTVFLTDGMPFMFDGRTLSESGFNHFPLAPSNQGLAGAGGLLAAGSYQWLMVFEWVDASGQRYQSAPGVTLTVTVVANDYINLRVPTLVLTDKSNVKLVIYRTIANGGIFYREKDLDNDPSTPYIATTSGQASTGGLSDSLLAGSEALYTTGGILDHIAPPAPIYMATHNNRLFVVAEDNTIYYSKEWVEGNGVQFSDAFRIVVDPAGGRVSGVASLANQLLIAKERKLLRTYGDGPNDLGQGGYSQPISVSRDLGLRFGQQMLEWAGGVIIPSHKGLWNIDQSFSLNHDTFGHKIQDSENNDWVGSVVSINESRLFFVSTNETLMFDYDHGLWLRWTLTGALAAIARDDSFLWAKSESGSTLYSPAATFEQDLSTNLTTGWIRPGNINGFTRLLWIHLLGEFKAAHTLTVTLDYENGESEVFTKEWFSADEPYVLRMKPKRQRAGAFKITISDGSSGGTHEGAVWHGLTLEIIRKGKYPLGPLKTL